MSIEEKILSGVTLQPQINPEHFVYDSQLGMLVQEVEALSGDRLVRVLGFHSTQDETLQELTPTRDFSRLPVERQTLNSNAKGTGIMLGGSAQVVLRPAYKGNQPGVNVWLSPPLHETEIADTRAKNPESLTQIAFGIGKHAVRAWIEARLMGDKRVVERINKSYEEFALVTMNPAPTWLIAQRLAAQKLLGKSEVPPTWALYRGQMPLKRVGQYVPVAT